MPPQVTMLPTFLIMAKFPLAGGNNLLGAGGTGLINTYAGLVIPLVSGSYGVFLCKQFYENFPRSLDEAAEIDGANKWRTYFTIYLPNSKAILATLGLLKAVSVWNDYMWPLIMTNSENMRTVQLALTMFKTDSGIMWNQMMAGSVLVALPMFVLFLCAQKYFIQGIVTSGLK
jgi:multiple sugar transport system permease protein